MSENQSSINIHLRKSEKITSLDMIKAKVGIDVPVRRFILSIYPWYDTKIEGEVIGYKNTREAHGELVDLVLRRSYGHMYIKHEYDDNSFRFKKVSSSSTFFTECIWHLEAIVWYLQESQNSE